MDQSNDSLTSFVSNLEAKAELQVGKRQIIENRWLRNLRQYHSIYDEDVLVKINALDGSKLFVNITRPKTHAWAARLGDMLFPTDERNWSIRPTPTPEIQQILRRGQPAPLAPPQSSPAVATAPIAAVPSGDPAAPTNALPSPSTSEPGDGGTPQASVAPTPPVVKDPLAQEAREIIEEARKRSDAMGDEMEAQLRRASYSSEMRRVIHDSAKLGSGVAKGPTVASKTRKRWAKDEDGIQVLQTDTDFSPVINRVDLWGFFPDMDAVDMANVGFTFERHLKTEKGLKKLAKQPGFDQDAMRSLIEEGPSSSIPDYLTRLRAMADTGLDSLDNMFHVWEYHGPINYDELKELFVADDRLEDFNEDFGALDPLTEVNVIAFFCQGRLLKFGEHPLESGDTLYSVFNFESDDTSIFGYGVPHIIQDSQKALNGAWRMLMDNAGLSVGPQVVIDTKMIAPENGSYVLTPRKIWRKIKSQVPGAAPPFEVFDIPSNQAALTQIIQLAEAFADEETSMPNVAQGEPGTGVKSSGGMAVLMNSVNVIFRRVVKNFDDQMTVPNIRRLYDWNQQFNKKESIKGDYEVDARGSSVLLVREVQAQNLMVLLSTFSNHPVLGELTKVAPLYRKAIQAQMLNPDEIVLTDDEIAEKVANAPPPPPSPAESELQGKMQLAQLDNQTKLAIAKLSHQTAMMKMAETTNVSIQQIQADLAKQDSDQEHDMRRMAAEMGYQNLNPDRSGSGGSI